MRLRSLCIFFLILCLVSISTLANVLPALAASQTPQKTNISVQKSQSHRSAINTTDPILLIHGVSGSASVDCNNYWGHTEQFLQATHTVAGQQISWTGPIVKIGYYTNDNINCYDNLAKVKWPHCKGYEDQNIGTTSESIKHLGCELAWFIYSNYSQHGQNVEVIGHSMGGLIIRWALYGTQAHLKHFPTGDIPSASNLLVRDVVDFDTPNRGIDPKLFDVGVFGVTLGGILGCTKKNGTWVCPAQVMQMRPDSPFIKYLDSNAQNPQGAQSTLWTLMGVTKGTACLSLPVTSTAYMDGANKVLYTYPCYSHISLPQLRDLSMMDDPDPTDTLDGKVQYCNLCSKYPVSLQSSSSYPHVLLSTLYALTEQTIFPHGELIVTITSDFAAPCTLAAYSLRCAILQANNDGQGDTIKFSIEASDSGCSGATVCTIMPTSSLPALTASNTVINGYSQQGAKKNTQPMGQGDNAIIKVRIDGSNGVGGLVLSGNASKDTVEGLEITNFNYGILLYPKTVTNNLIVGNFIGTDGINALGNNAGVYVSDGTFNTIGGTTPDAVNLISGNKQDGITIGNGFENRIGGNYIGTDRSSSAALKGSSIPVIARSHSSGIPNGVGIVVFASSLNTYIGSTQANAGNIIAYNTYGILTDGSRGVDIEANQIRFNTVGVYVNNGEYEDFAYQNAIYNNINSGILVGNSSTDHARIDIQQNTMHDNGGSGIDLYPIHTVNCSNATSGAPNDYLSCPIIQKATTTQVNGIATPKSFVDVYIASNDSDDQGHGEGETYLTGVYTDANGNWSVNTTLTSGNIVTATATLNIDGVGETSEFAANSTV